MEIDRDEELQRVPSGLYETVDKVVWILKIQGKYKNSEGYKMKGNLTLTAFAVRPGYLLTCPRGWDKWDEVKFEAKPLRGLSDKWFDAVLEAIELKADMCLLELTNCHEANNVARLGSGNLEAGDPILLIGHPEFFVGSGVLGVVNYPCTETTSFGFQSHQPCRTYSCNALANTPAYRIMGHVWNKGVVGRLKKKASKYEYELDLLAEIPILQCSALVGGSGTSGGPLFNKEGEVVGMFVGETIDYHPYQIGIHIAAIKLFLEESLKGKDEGPSQDEKIFLEESLKGKDEGPSPEEKESLKGKDEGSSQAEKIFSEESLKGKDEGSSQEEKSEDMKTGSKKSKKQKRALPRKSKKQKRGPFGALKLRIW